MDHPALESVADKSMVPPADLTSLGSSTECPALVIDEPETLGSEEQATPPRSEPKDKETAISSIIRQHETAQSNSLLTILDENHSFADSQISYPKAAYTSPSAGPNVIPSDVSLPPISATRSVHGTSQSEVKGLEQSLAKAKARFRSHNGASSSADCLPSLARHRSKRFMLDDVEGSISMPPTQQNTSATINRPVSIGPPRRAETDPIKRTQPRPSPYKFSKSEPSNLAPARPLSHSVVTPADSQNGSLPRVNSMRSYQESQHSAWNGSIITNSSSKGNDVGASFQVPLELGQVSGIVKCATPSSNEFAVFMSPKTIMVCPLHDDEHLATRLVLPKGWTEWISVSVAGDYIFARSQPGSTRQTIVSKYSR
jgi:hypothetical protein